MILIIVKNFLSLLLTLCSSQGSAYCHQKFVMQNACLRLRSHTNVSGGFDNDYEIYIHVFSKILQKYQ